MTMVGDAAVTGSGPLPSRLLAFEGRAMGSPLRLAVAVEAEPAGRSARVDAEDVWCAVRDEFEAAEAAMSRFRDDSEITRLNRAVGVGPAIRVSARLRQSAVRQRPCPSADRGPIRSARAPRPRAPGRRRRADRRRVAARGADGRVRTSGGRIVQWLPDGRVRLSAPVDLGGIGKGLALRWASATARRLGTEAFLLEAGGDLVASGRPPEGGTWRVGLQDPAGGPDPLAVIAATDEAVTTSSVRLRRWTIGEREVHHLIDPRTGEPGGAGLLAVTVAGPDPAWSEVWSKTLFLEGRAGIAALARRLGLAAWWVGDDGALEMTAAARVRTIWVAAEDDPGRVPPGASDHFGRDHRPLSAPAAGATVDRS